MNQTLPQRLYLLGYDTDKRRIGVAQFRGHLMRAAALTELVLDGLLGSEGKKVARRTGTAPGDSFLTEVLHDVGPDKPRHWITLVQLNSHRSEATVRGQLAETGVITVRDGKALGFLPTHEVTVDHPEQVHDLRERVRNAALLGRDPATVPVDEAAMAVLAAEGEVGTVHPGGAP